MLRKWIHQLKEQPQKKCVQEAITKTDLAPRDLRDFSVFNGYSHEDLMVFAEKAEKLELDAGEILFKEGDNCARDYLLLRGRLELQTGDGESRNLVSGTPAANNPVSSLRPHVYTATALESCTYICIDPNLSLNHRGTKTTAEFSAVGTIAEFQGMELSSINPGETRDNQLLMHRFTEDLDNGRFTLTCLPETALNIRKVISNSHLPAIEMAELLMVDPIITAKVLQIANGPFYRGYEPCGSLSDAIVRLGIATVRSVVLSFTIRDLFKTDSPALRRSMRSAWEQTARTAAIAAVLAKRTRKFAPEEAMLAAILSNVGVLSIFNYLTNHPEIYRDRKRLDQVLLALKGKVGQMVLGMWGLSDSQIDYALNAEHWLRRGTSAEPDLCDLVIVANYHANIGKRPLPFATRLPACQKLLGDTLSAEYAITFLRDAAADIEDAHKIISM